MTVNDLITQHKERIVDAGKDYGKISLLYKELVKNIQSLPSPHDEILSMLEKLAENPFLQDAKYWITAAQIHSSINYLKPLCAALMIENKCIWYEGVIDVLWGLADERAIPALKKALTYDLEYDEWNRIAINSLHALAEIGTDEAIRVIRKQVESPIERISEEAKDLLLFIESNE